MFEHVQMAYVICTPGWHCYRARLLVHGKSSFLFVLKNEDAIHYNTHTITTIISPAHCVV